MPVAGANRRAFIAALGGAAAWPLVARAQQGERVRQIGVLSTLAADDPDTRAQIEAFVQGLAELGWTDGRNVRLDIRWAAGNADVRACHKPQDRQSPRPHHPGNAVGHR